MKRSEINKALKELEAMCAREHCYLPPFCHFTPEEWKTKGHEYDEVRDCMLGWDITDYGLGDFDKVGFSLITIRNGNRAMQDKYPKVYAEKLLYMKEGQYSPNHFHWYKTEDIINRGGGSFPKPLTAEEERMYLQRSAAGDLEARNILIERNLRLVAHIMKKYYSQSADQEDLISIGTIGLIKGISTFDAAKGARLATYAARCVENEILMYFRSMRKTAGDVSLSDCIETGKDGNALSLMDVLCSDEDLFEDLSARQTYRKLYEVMDTVLSPRERMVITLRYGLGDRTPLTQREIAAKCGISRSYVSRIEKKALAALQQALQGYTQEV